MSLNLESPRQLSKRTGWPERRIRSLIAENRIKHLRIGGNILLPVDAIDEFVRTNMIDPNRDGEPQPLPQDHEARNV